MARYRPNLIAGLFLIAIGLVFLLNYFIPTTWPLVILALGAACLLAAFFWRRHELTITGTLNLVLGGILLYQATTQNWISWLYLWPLLFTGIGSGMLLQGWLAPYQGLRSGRYMRVSSGFLAAGLLFTAGFMYFRALISWPSILWGTGALFLFVGLVSGLRPLLIPASILGGLGLLLAWQNATGNWSSWAYAWALLPAFVGVGLFFGFLRHRVVRVVGLSLTGWSLLVFIVFGLFFASDGLYARFWPVTLILGGLMFLIQTFIVPRQGLAKHTGS